MFYKVIKSFTSKCDDKLDKGMILNKFREYDNCSKFYGEAGAYFLYDDEIKDNLEEYTES